ncbi:hypothetical protein [Nitrobacter sp.]|uniref:hypothetical protein n=1 Tax=Nitrobacter sp. TaxID=29420 RepID=UPI003F64B308
MPNAALKAAREPASIRYKNPGAMWGGRHANTWGAVSDVVLKDGQANHIAVFPDVVHGAAAQFALWKVGYCNMSLAAAIKKWSGHNSSAAYMAFLGKHVGITAETWITPALLASPKGLALMQAQAQWEAGKPYPMTETEWRRAQAMVFPVA